MTSAAHLIFSFIPHRLPSFKYSEYQTEQAGVKKHINGLVKSDASLFQPRT